MRFLIGLFKAVMGICETPPLDGELWALEGGRVTVSLKEATGGEVTVITMGPPQAEEVLCQAIACGADNGVLISDRNFAGADTWATSYTLAKAITTLGDFDMIICGKQAIDGDTAQVGPGLAMRLGIPYATCIQKIREAENSAIVMERMMDDGYDEIEMQLPGLLTVVKEINDLRVPSLKGKMKAKKVEVKVMSAADIEADPDSLGLKGSTTQVVKVFSPQAKGDREMITGTVSEQVEQLVQKLE